MIFENFFSPLDNEYTDNNESRDSLNVLGTSQPKNNIEEQFPSQSNIKYSKKAHSLSEKRRRTKMNTTFEKMRTVLNASEKSSKNNLLEIAIKCIEKCKESEIKWKKTFECQQRKIEELEVEIRSSS